MNQVYREYDTVDPLEKQRVIENLNYKGMRIVSVTHPRPGTFGLLIELKTETD